MGPNWCNKIWWAMEGGLSLGGGVNMGICLALSLIFVKGRGM